MSAVLEGRIGQLLSMLGPDDSAAIVVLLDVLEEQLDHLAASFPSDVRHCIAIKTMPHPAMLEHVVAAGFGLEAASMEEVDLALLAGARPESIVFDSPAKTRREIDRCASELPGLHLNANSLSELGRIPPDAELRIGLRINPELSAGAPDRYRVSAPGGRFGVAISEEESIIAASLSHRIEALHVHVGSQLPDASDHAAAIGRVVDLADRIDDARVGAGLPTRISTIDIGGGVAADPLPVAEQEGSGIERLVAALAISAPGLFERQVMTEFGQWVHRHAGAVISRVEYVGHGARPHATLHVGADLFMRQVYAEPQGFSFAAHKLRPSPDPQLRHRYDLEGPLCFAGDVIATEVDLPALDEGDWIIIGETGANTLGLWSRHCSRHLPAVLAICEGEIARWSPRRSVSEPPASSSA